MPEQNDYYRLLQIWREASPETIEGAYRRLSEAAGDNPERRRELDEAYAVLSDPERRAEHDRQLADQAARVAPDAEMVQPAANVPAEARNGEPEVVLRDAGPAPVAAGSGGGGFNVRLLGVLVGVLFLTIAVSAALIGFALIQDDGDKYPSDRAPEDYDLAAMQLRNADLPTGMVLQQADDASNEEWAAALAQGDDPQARLQQLEALGRQRGYRAIYAWEDPSKHFGGPVFIATQSTLYEDARSAAESMEGVNYCGTLIDPNDTANVIKDFPVPNLGEGATGFQVLQPIQIADGLYEQVVETLVCFRTGRVLHVVSETSLTDGADVGLTYRLAQSMLRRVDESFEGKGAPLDGTPTQPPG
ncbi:MAG: J domain-containing protein [Hyphomicrobiales bacterium]